MLFGPLGIKFSEMLIKIQNFSFTKMHNENIVCEMTAILYWGRQVNTTYGHVFAHLQLLLYIYFCYSAD